MTRCQFILGGWGTKILLGYDGSENARVALSKATKLIKNSDGELVIIVVATVPIPAPYAQRAYYEQVRNDIMQNSRNLLTEASDLAKQAGVARVSGLVEEGFPAESIVSHASEIGADLIVIGRRGIRGVDRKLIGSVSSSILAQSKCDVLVAMA